MIESQICKSCGKEWVDHLGVQSVCAENVKLKDIIQKASTAFCEDGSDGYVASKMFKILGEAYTK
jgi:hypothetical protein